MPVFRGPKQLGAFGELGGAMQVDIVPSPDRASFGLMKLAGYLEDTAAPMRASKAIAIADMHNHFDTDTAPNGDAWAPLDPDYAKAKARDGFNPSDILTRTGGLERKATSRHAWIVRGDSMFFVTTGLPEWWGVHQFGSDPEGLSGYAATWRVLDKSMRKDDETGKTIGARSNLGIGRGKATPARPFVGLSDKAILQIRAVFDLWFDEGVNVAVSAAGTVQERLGGRFGKKLFPSF